MNSKGNNPPWQPGDSAEIQHLFTATDVESFSQLSGDDNPLHMDEAYAKGTLAGGRVVHGMLTAAWISTLIGTKCPGKGALWNRFSIDWKRMVRIGDTIVFKATVTEVHDNMLELSIEGRRFQGELVLEATARVMLMEDAQSAIKNPEPQSSLSFASPSQIPVLQEDHAQETLSARPFILITGATGGLGEVLVAELLERFPQVHLLLWGRNAEKLSAYSANPRITTHQVDLAQAREVQSALETIPKTLKLVGLVHLAAAPWRPVPVVAADNLKELENHWRVGMGSYAQMITHLRPQMEAGCSLIALSTQFAISTPPENCAAYISAKLALEGYTRSLALELGPAGIRANMLAPSMINTAYVQDIPVRKKMVEAAKNPLRRLCTAQEVANTIAWLLSDQASFINGTTIPLTGGLSL